MAVLRPTDEVSGASADRRISVVIPTLGRPGPLRSCLACIARQTLPVAEVLVVHCGDDAATREVVLDPAWQTAGLTCRYFHFPERNAAKQRDFAIRQAQHDNLLLLDDDVEVEPEWAQEMFQPIWADAKVGAKVGATMGRIVNAPMVSPTFVWRCYRVLAVPASSRDVPGRLVGAALPNGFSLDLLTPVATEWIGGGVSAMTRQAYLSVGGFAPYFTGSSPGEDLDLGYRMSRSWRVLYVPAARCIHSLSAEKREGTDRHQYLSVRSRYAIQVAAMGRSRIGALFHCLLWVLFQSVSELAALRHGGIRADFPGVVRGRVAGLASCVLWRPVAPAVSTAPAARRLQP